MAELKTQGTDFYILDAADTGSEVIKIVGITGFSGVGGTAGEIDITDLDSVAREFLPGLKDNGSISLNLKWEPDEASQVKLEELFGGANVRFLVAGAEAATAPTFSGGSYTIPTDRTTLDFSAGVLQFQKDSETDNIWRATVSLRVSGAITITPVA